MSYSCINAVLWLARAPTGWAMLRSAKGKASRHCCHLLTTPPSTLARHPNRQQWSHWVEEKKRRNLIFFYSTPIWSDNCAFVMRAATHLPLRVRVLGCSGQRLKPLHFSVLFLGSYLCCLCFVPGCVLNLSSVAVWWLLSAGSSCRYLFLFFFHKWALLFVPQDRGENTRRFQYLIYACFFKNFILSFMLCFYLCWTGVCWCVKAWVPCVRRHFVSLRWSDVLDVLASLGLRKDENCFKNLNGFGKTWILKHSVCFVEKV